MKHNVIIINGPNLNLLGEREKEQYGSVTLGDIEKHCKEYGAKNNIRVTFFQSNIEGEIVTEIQNLVKIIMASLSMPVDIHILLLQFTMLLKY